MARSRTPVQVVLDFCAAWSRHDADELAAYFTDDAVYHNMPSTPVTGRDAIRASIERFSASWQEVEFEVLNIAASGDTVLAERVDRIRTTTGSVDLPVTGAFEVDGDRISAWRDYFDLEQFRKGLAPASS